jgi:hypothetical protein
MLSIIILFIEKIVYYFLKLMKKVILLVVLLQVCTAIISDAPYIYQFDRPKIAGHRGLSSIFPGNTFIFYY